MSFVRRRCSVRSPSPFFSLRSDTSARRVVGDGGAHYCSVGVGEPFGSRTVHILSREDVHPLHSVRGRERGASADERYRCSSCGERTRYRIAHLARRVIRDESHGVYRLDCRTSRNYQPATCEATLFFFGEDSVHEPYYRFRFSHATLARQTARQLALGRVDDGCSARTEYVEIRLRRRMREHVAVHRRSDDGAAAGGQIGREQQIVGDAVSHLGDGIRRGWGDKIAVRPLAHRDVGVPVAVFGVVELDGDRILGQRRHSNRRDELLGGRRHYDPHLRTRGFQKTTKHSRLICRYAAGYTQ